VRSPRTCAAASKARQTPSRHGIVGLRLREQPLRLGDFRDARQAAPVPRARLTLRRRRRLTLDRGVLRNSDGGLHQCARPRVLSRQRLNSQVVACALGELVLQLDPLAGIHREQVKRGKRDLQAGRPIGHLRPEPVVRRRLSWHLGASVSAGKCRLKVDAREVRAIQHPFARTDRFNHRQLCPRRRMRREISRSQRWHLR